MRPLKVVMSAFGPYPDKVEIPLHQLGKEGLFLITGETGAGKTTIFDAIAFALFDGASGSVRPVDTLRSDFAAADTRTYVELEFLHKGQPFHITRNPKYLRPKKSGTGFTYENADANLVLPDGKIVTGNNKVTDKIVELLGIDFKQFKQIAMIPQGEFLKLLLAESNERVGIFRKVFNTDIYLNIQESLKKREKGLKVQYEEKIRSILQYVDSIQCDEEDERYQQLAEMLSKRSIHGTEPIITLLQDVIAEDRLIHDQAKQQSDELANDIMNKSAELKEAEYMNKFLQDLETAQEKLRELMQKNDEVKLKETVVSAAEKALRLVKPLEDIYMLEKRNQATLVTSIHKLKNDIDVQTPIMKKLHNALIAEQQKEGLREKLANDIMRVKSALPQYDKVENLKQRRNRQTHTMQVLERSLASLVIQKEELGKRKVILSQERDGIGEVETRLIEHKNTIENLEYLAVRLQNIATGIESVQKMYLEHAELQRNYLIKEKKYNTANAEYISKEEAFFREQAGILAAGLRDEQPCPVCGSTIHPQKAKPTADAPSEAEIQRLKTERERRQQSMQKASEIASQKKARLEISAAHLYQTARDLFAQDSPENITELKQFIQSKLAASTRNKEEKSAQLLILQGQSKRKTECSEELRQIEEKLQETGESHTRQLEQKGNLAISLSSIDSEIKTLQEVLDYPSLEKARLMLDSTSAELEQLKIGLQKAEQVYLESKQMLDSYHALVDDQELRLQALAEAVDKAHADYICQYKKQGFADENEYHASLLTEPEITDIKLKIADHKETYGRTNSDILRLEAETKGKKNKDITWIINIQRDIQHKKEVLDRKVQRVAVRINNNEKIALIITEAEKQRIQLEKDYLIVSKLSKTASGELTGKQKIAFEQYVQAFYFSQIIAEANQRLTVMSNGRFELLRQKNASDYRSQSGLELDVLDNYTGKKRTVKSLSGGESFKASLALALGLADIIQSYAGGVEIDTMFVDEGFGALDAESLEQAILTLNNLTFGNRLVGIISHVSELKDRIEKKIVIKKGLGGSTIELIN